MSRINGLEKRFLIVLMSVAFLASGVGTAICSGVKLHDSWRDQILYFVLVDRFENGCLCSDFDVDPRDPRGFHGGDLDGLRMRLQYLQDLGVTGVWVSPVARNRPMPFFGQQPYHGYWAWDFFSVDPRFGTMRKLREVRDDLHRRGMKLLLDMVVNHAGYDAPIEKLHPDLFHANGEIEDWNDRAQVERFRLFGLPDFASEKAIVQQYFTAVAKHWVEQIQPDGFRLDAVKHVSIGFWKKFNDMLAGRFGSGFLTLGELLEGDPAELSRVWKAGAFATLFDYPLYYTLLDVIAHGGDARQFGVRFGMDRIYEDAGLLATFLDNHDLDRFMTSCGGSREKYMLAMVLLMTARGIPTLCYGDEIGLDGAHAPDCRNRRSMKFESGNIIYKEIKKLIAIRRNNRALTRGIQTHLAMSSDMYAFGRLLPGQQAVAVFNFATSPQEIRVPPAAPLPDGRASVDLVTGLTAVVGQGSLKMKLPGNGYAVFVIDADKPDTWKKAYETLTEASINPFARGKQKVTFRLQRDEKLPDGASLCLIGGLPQLGDWKADSPKLPKLVRTGLNVWSANVDLPTGAVFEYKFLVRASDGTPTWQQGGNAVLEVRPGMRPVIENTW